MKLRPLQDRIVVRRIASPDRSGDVVAILETPAEKPKESPGEGEVLAVGVGVRDERGALTPIGVNPGERVLFSTWTGPEFRLDGEDLMIMRESDLLCVIEAGMTRNLQR